MSAEQLPDLVIGYIAANLRRIRLKEGLTQERLAELAGVDLTYVQRVERGSQNLTVRTMVRLAQALDVQPSRLLRECKPAERQTGRPPKKRRVRGYPARLTRSQPASEAQACVTRRTGECNHSAAHGGTHELSLAGVRAVTRSAVQLNTCTKSAGFAAPVQSLRSRASTAGWPRSQAFSAVGPSIRLV